MLNKYRNAGFRAENIDDRTADFQTGLIGFIHVAYRKQLLPTWFTQDSENACVGWDLATTVGARCLVIWMRMKWRNIMGIS
jgi:hypothetical protein